MQSSYTQRISLALMISLPARNHKASQLIDAFNARVGKHVERCSQFIQQREALTEDVRSVTFEGLERSAADARQQELELLQTTLKLADDRQTVLADVRPFFADDLKESEKDYDKTFELTRKALAKIGITPESQLCYAAAPEKALNDVNRQIRQVPAVIEAQQEREAATHALQQLTHLAATTGEIQTAAVNDVRGFIFEALHRRPMPQIRS